VQDETAILLDHGIAASASATAQDAGSPSAAPAAAEVNPAPANADVKKLAPRMRSKARPSRFVRMLPRFPTPTPESMCLLLEAAARANGLPVEFSRA